MKRYSLFFSMVALLFLSLSVEAQTLLTGLASDYQSATSGWMSKAQAYALQLFYWLASIEIAVIAIWHLLRQDGLAEFIASFLLQLLGILFFYTMLIQSPQWIPAIVNSFIVAGKNISAASLDPASIVNSGIELATTMMKVDVSIFSAPMVVATAVLSAIGVVIAYLLISGELFLVTAEFYIIGYGGILILGFSGSHWTRFISEGYLSAILKIGIKLFVLYLVLGLGLTLVPKFLDSVVKGMEGGNIPDVSTYLSVLSGSAMLALIAWRIPNLAAGMIGGGPSLGISGAVGMVMGGASLSKQITHSIVNANMQIEGAKRSAESLAKLEAATKFVPKRKIGD